MREKINVLGIISMIVGIISMVTSCCMGGFFGIIGIIIGILALIKPNAKKLEAIIGIITSTLAFFITLVVIVIGILGNSEVENIETTTEVKTTTESKTESTTEVSEEKVLSEEEFKASCDYVNNVGDLDNHKNIKIDLFVYQTEDLEYISCSGKSDYDCWTGEEIILEDNRSDKNLKIEKTNIITVYGTYEGTKEIEIENVNGYTQTRNPYIISAKYIDVISK